MDKIKLYKEEINNAMEWLAQKNDTLFIGQSVAWPGTGMYDSLTHISEDKKMEFPIVENFQMGFCIGMALNDFVPIAVYPRWNFLLCATDQIVNHLDKLFFMSDGDYNPKVIIRVAVGSETPVDPQDQHKGNFSESFRKMCKNIDVVELNDHTIILDEYKKAYKSNRSTILVEFPDYGK
jgi:pyruvate/2-oxoglutarate/acetoin dehydrogenase E1 component